MAAVLNRSRRSGESLAADTGAFAANGGAVATKNRAGGRRFGGGRGAGIFAPEKIVE
jgi:hypothetical protein